VSQISLNEKAFCTLKISPNKILIGGEKSLSLIKIIGLKIIIEKQKKANQSQINCIGWFHSEKCAVTGSSDGTISLWTFNRSLEDFEITGNTYPSTNGANPFIWSLLCLPKKGLVIVTNNTDSVTVFQIIFDKKQIEEVQILKGFKSKINSLNYIMKGIILASHHSSDFIHQIVLS
jgi:WD40 repeat protein